jgi:ribonuclease HI
LTAKYATTCGICAGPVSPGEQIVKVGSRWAHVRCAAEANRPQTVPSFGDPDNQKVRAGGGTRSDEALRVWTDGACSGNPGPGGWAWATQDGRRGSGGDPATTNQRMEIRAALEAVTSLEGTLVVVSDSTYVVNCFRDGWWRGWLARGWTTSAKKPVANRDLWEPLIDVVRGRGTITFQWVKGHSGDPMNDLVDRLAVEAGKTVTGSPARES